MFINFIKFIPYLSLPLSMPIPIPAHAFHSISLPIFFYLFLSLPLHLPSPAYPLHFPPYMSIPHPASPSPAYHFSHLSHNYPSLTSQCLSCLLSIPYYPQSPILANASLCQCLSPYLSLALPLSSLPIP